MTDVQNLTFNGNPVENVNFNGISLDNLIYNNYQWSASEPLTIKPIFVSSDPFSYVITSFDYESYVHITGNNCFLAKAITGNKDLGNSTITNANNTATIFPVDNWGFVFHKFSQYDQWEGGVSGGNYSFSETINHKRTSIPITFNTKLDEDNVALLEGCYVNKVVKVPSKGDSGQVIVNLYPYTFESNYYSSSSTPSIPLYLFNYDTNTLSEYNQGDGIFTSLTSTQSGLDITINYSISQNNTNDFRDSVVVLYSDYCCHVLIHFLQEPHSENRIYFGQKVDSQYLFKDAVLEDYGTASRLYQDDGKWIFCTHGSHVLEDYFELKSPYNNWYFYYPSSLEQRYTISVDGTAGRTYPTHYTWDNIDYICTGAMDSSTIYKFTKK